MLRALTPALRASWLKTLLLAVAGLCLAFLVRDWIVEGTVRDLSLRALGVVAAVIALFILVNWRWGAYLFLFWLIFEDLPRKYLGNNMVIYFGKDLLVTIVYAAFLFDLTKRRTHSFRPPFLVSLLVFVGIGVVQVFNPNSPSPLYGLLGLKLYYYYIPLMFIGYALINSETDLRRLLLFTVTLGALVAALGIVQGIVGLDFLNPQQLAPEIESLGRLTRYSPQTHVAVPHPTSVFVSKGRFSIYILMLFILALGVAGYKLLSRSPARRWVILALATMAVAMSLTGSRGAVLYGSASLLIISVALLWGAPRDWSGRARLRQAIRWTFAALAVSLVLTAAAFPEALEARWAFYYETLALSSPDSELVYRVRDYPIGNFLHALSYPQWPIGYGIGTSSLGVQYVNRLLGVPALNIGVESGYGTLLLEMGVPGLLAWLLWTTVTVVICWRVVRRLRGTVYFPVGFTIFWFVFLLLFPFTYAGFQAYQNYILNAHLWLLLGVLFRLPSFAAEAQRHAWSQSSASWVPDRPQAAPVAGRPLA